MLSIYVHKKRYKINKIHDREVLNILSNKERLYGLTPQKWKPKFLILNNKKIEYIKSLIIDPWFKKSLETKGLIIKPLYGFGSRDVYRFKITKNILWKEKLFK